MEKPDVSADETPSQDKAVAPEETINIKLGSQDGTEIFFKIKKTTPMSRVFEAYCAKTGAAFNSVRFLFDGTRLTGNDTPESLDLENNDGIDVVVSQTGGNYQIPATSGK